MCYFFQACKRLAIFPLCGYTCCGGNGMNTFFKDSSQYKHDMTFHYIYRDYPLLHNHDYWEFFVVITGVYKHTLNEQAGVVNVNSAYLIRPNDVHSLRNNTASASHLNILIRDRLMRSVCDCLAPGVYGSLLEGNGVPVLLDEIHTKQLFNYTSLLEQYQEDEANYDLVSRLILFFILEKILYQNKFTDSKKPKWLNELLQRINSPYNANWQLDDFIRTTNYSHSYFTRQFNKYMGCSPIQYITNEKMARACNYLIHSDMSILAIASALGYTNLSHFNHIFKATYNVSPTQYRKRNQNPH